MTDLTNKMVTFDELRDYGVLLGRKQIGRLEKIGRFPKRVQISEARIGWLEREIVDYVKTRVDAR